MSFPPYLRGACGTSASRPLISISTRTTSRHQTPQDSSQERLSMQKTSNRDRGHVGHESVDPFFGFFAGRHIGHGHVLYRSGVPPIALLGRSRSNYFFRKKLFHSALSFCKIQIVVCITSTTKNPPRPVVTAGDLDYKEAVATFRTRRSTSSPKKIYCVSGYVRRFTFTSDAMSEERKDCAAGRRFAASSRV